MLLPGLAHATTYYVSPGGSDSNSGLTALTPWATIGRANNALTAGDAVRILPGTYSDRINPARSGSALARISYIGDLSSPGAANVPGIDVFSSYVTVKGVNSADAGHLEYPARNDSLAFCVLGGGQVLYGVKYSMIAHNIINGGVSWELDKGLSVGPATSNCEQDTMRGNIITQASISPSHGFKFRGYTQYCLVDSNQIAGTFTSNTVDGSGRIAYNSYYDVFRDNRWTYEATVSFGPNGPWKAFVLRDSTHDLTFERDTLLAGLQSPYDIGAAISTSGNFGEVRNNVWRGCVYKTNSSIYNTYPLTNGLFQNSVFACKGDAVFWFQDQVNNCTFDHCTFYSAAGQAMRIDAPMSATTFTSNVFYTQSARAPATNGGTILFGTTTGFTSNYNLFFSPAYSSTPGDRSIAWCCYNGSRPGTGQGWNNATGQDAGSHYGSPMMLDSTFTNLDGHLLLGSLAIGAGASGSDAGAYPFVPIGPDVTPPSSVNNLAASLVSDQVIVMTWTAPGGDGMSGQAAAYDLRWSNQPITAATFAAATSVTPQPIPSYGGTSQSYVLTGRTPGATYYLAIMAVDQAGNWSGLSNVLNTTMQASDQTPPRTIGDLGTSP
ncbi:MAG: hypothetical protein HY076_04665 [Candidatus Eisenbacteria bacterium]|uniref:Fibronectin type-III domain-containing protein n=1 Tax=Eiseniibacteriota bacterium TaxID=2212470 RepID=A0A9D6QMA2_UNCEI|nr:hypothetical protein [Candidatus Eisenbacteria bacterium]